MHSDAVIWSIIDRVGIKDIIPTLDFKVSDGGSIYSSGQKQLICLVRAAVNKSKILILDEATTHVDIETDKNIHKVIEEIFSKCTILMIAHRLHIIKNCDRILVVQQGKIVEYDEPKALLEKKDSLFNEMCENSDFT